MVHSWCSFNFNKVLVISHRLTLRDTSKIIQITQTNKSTSWLCHAIRVCTKNCTLWVQHLISQIVPNKLDKSHWSNLNGSLLKDIVYTVLIWGAKWRQATFSLVHFFGACNGRWFKNLPNSLEYLNLYGRWQQFSRNYSIQ